MKLLLVDDEIVALKALKNRIDWIKYGFTDVYTAQDAESARKVLSEEKIDLAICDVEMPGENGISLVAYINEHYPETDKMLLTCHADFSYVQRALRVGARDYILKPVDYEELNQVLIKFVEDYNSRNDKKKIEKILSTKDQDEDKILISSDRIEIIKNYIEEHLGEKLYVEDLAKLIHVNEQYFMRLFKKHFGMSVTEYIARERVKMASLMLRNTDKSINYIADCVGFENDSYFAKTFKKYTDMTPREYRSRFGK